MTRSGFSCVRPDLITLSLITNLMTPVIMSWETLADVSGDVPKGHTHTHLHPCAHAYGHADGICEFLVIIRAVSGADSLRNRQVMKTYGEMVVKLPLLLTLVLSSSFSGRFITGTNRSCLLDKGIFIYTLQAVWSLWWDGIFLPNKPRPSST